MKMERMNLPQERLHLIAMNVCAAAAGWRLADEEDGL
jgi:hypothetical protein